LPFQICLRLRQSVLRIPLHGDVIAVNHVACLMAGHLHDVFLWDACQGHVAGGGASEVMEMVVGDPGLGECLLPGATKVPNGSTLPMKDPGSPWMSGEPAPLDDLGEFSRETQHLHVFIPTGLWRFLSPYVGGHKKRFKTGR